MSKTAKLLVVSVVCLFLATTFVSAGLLDFFKIKENNKATGNAAKAAAPAPLPVSIAFVDGPIQGSPKSEYKEETVYVTLKPTGKETISSMYVYLQKPSDTKGTGKILINKRTAFKQQANEQIKYSPNAQTNNLKETGTYQVIACDDELCKKRISKASFKYTGARCEDLDSGKDDKYIYSYVAHGQGGMFSDRCEDGRYLNEALCEYGLPALKRIDCGTYGCTRGVCRDSKGNQPEKYHIKGDLSGADMDTKSGKLIGFDLYTGGVITLTNPGLTTVDGRVFPGSESTSYEYCNGNILSESYIDEYGYPAFKEYTCGLGCDEKKNACRALSCGDDVGEGFECYSSSAALSIETFEKCNKGPAYLVKLPKGMQCSSSESQNYCYKCVRK